MKILVALKSTKTYIKNNWEMSVVARKMRRYKEIPSTSDHVDAQPLWKKDKAQRILSSSLENRLGAR